MLTIYGSVDKLFEEETIIEKPTKAPTGWKVEDAPSKSEGKKRKHEEGADKKKKKHKHQH